MPRITPPSGGGSLAAGSVGAKELKTITRTPWMPTGAISESVHGRNNTNLSALSSGRLSLSALKTLPGGVGITDISFFSGATALVTGSNQWFCLVDRALNVLAKTADDTSTAWAANALKTLAIAGGPYIPADDIEVFAGIVVVAATPPTLAGYQAAAGSIGPFNAANSPMGGASTTGLTNPASLGATAAALSASHILPYAYVR